MRDIKPQSKTINSDVIKHSQLNRQTLSSIEHEHGGSVKSSGTKISPQAIKLIALGGALIALIILVAVAWIFMKVLF